MEKLHRDELHHLYS